MTGFSWAQQIAKAEKLKLRRERNLAKSGNTDFRLDHPDEYREAQDGKFIMLDKRVLLKLKKHVDREMTRRKKIAGK